MTSYPIAASSTPPPYAASSTSIHLGQTRSRTLLFLSYRDSAGPSTSRSGNPSSSSSNVYFQAPYTDDDDPLHSSSIDIHSDVETLLPSTCRRSREGHISLPLDPPSELAPKWMDVSDSVDSILTTIRPRMDRLSRLHEKHLRPGFADKSSEEKQIEALALEITKDFRRCSRLVAGLASFSQKLIREAKKNQSHVTVGQIALAQNVQTALATRVQDLSGAFRKQQSLYLKRMKGMQVRDRDIRAARGLAPPTTTSNITSLSFKDSEWAVREDIQLATLSSTSNSTLENTKLLTIQQEPSHPDLAIQYRTQEIVQIAKSIQDLATLFSDLQTLVIDQGTLMDRIDYNVELISTELKGAVDELHVATSYQRSSARRQCILFLVLCIAVLVAIIVVKPFWRFFTSASGSVGGDKAKRE